MAATSELDRVAMVVLRYMRGPIFTLIFVYAVGITGMALIPGFDADGNPARMSLFHAFYFFTYTATTTGFGEIPTEFSDAQRLWAILCIYMGVVAWLYAIGSIFRLVQNPHFLNAVSERGFARSVRAIRGPFYIVCGFGDTGSLLARGLSDRWLRGVIIDTDPERIKALRLRDYNTYMPGLCADPTVPRHLVDAGVQMPNCRALVILTVNEEINMRISTITRLLNPDIHILCRSSSRPHIEQLTTLGNVTIINPFEIFAQLLSMAIAAPRLHNLNSCLVHVQDVELGQPIQVPRGDWVICGYGRMGRWMYRYFVQNGIRPVIIDPRAEDVEGAVRIIRGPANLDTLLEAGIDRAAGVVVGTDSDHDNLSILMSVRTVKPETFIIMRQNDHQNQLAFDAAGANLVLQSSLTTARRVLKHLISPQVHLFIEYLRNQGEDICGHVVERLRTRIGDRPLHLWQVKLNRRQAAAVALRLHRGEPLTLGELKRDPCDRESPLPCLPLSLARGGNHIMLPGDSEPLRLGDHLLFCGTEQGERLLSASMNNEYTLDYLVSGRDRARGYLFQWLEARRERQSLPG